MNKRHVVIIGGGISGLSTAYFLSRRASRENLPIEITVLEADDRFGGVLRTLSCEGFPLDVGADAFYAGENDARDLCRELGLQQELVEAAPCFRRFFILKNKKYFLVPGFPGSFSDVALLFRNPCLSFSAKCRMLLEPFIPPRKENGDESPASFICRRLGRGFYQEIAKPLIRGVYLADPEQLSLEAVFPRWRESEKARGSLAASFWNATRRQGTKESVEFLSLKKGLEDLIRALIRQLEGCNLRKGTRVRKCVYGEDWELTLENGETLRAEALCLAMNACDAAKLIVESFPDLSRELSSVRYDSIAVVNLIYRAEDVRAEDLNFGFLVPGANESCPFSSLKWLGKKASPFSGPPSAHGAYLCLKAFISEAMLPEIFREEDEAIKRKVRISLGNLLSARAVPRFVSVERYPHALPQYEKKHFELVRHIEGKLRRASGLYLVGNGFRGFGITDCIREARATAFRI